MNTVKATQRYLALISVIIGLLPLPVNAESAQNLDQLMSRWTQTERQRGHLVSEWLDRQQLLEQQLTLLSAEEEALNAILGKSDNFQKNVDKERNKLASELTQFEREQSIAKNAIGRAIAKIKILHPQLPPPLHILWADELAILDGAELSNSERLEKLLSLLNQLDSFENRVALNQSLMTIPSSHPPPNHAKGQSAEQMKHLTKQVYLGLSQAWYVSEDGAYYGYGKPSSNGWKWWHQNAASELLGHQLSGSDVSAVVNMIEHPEQATFVSLPFKLDAKSTQNLSQAN